MRKNKFIRRKQEAMKNAILLLILVLGLGYALLQQNLTITGLSSIGNPTWNIHWENVQVKSGSVTGTNVVTAATIQNQTTVNYSVILNQPGDYYEFTVDAVNSGTIDGMIESITSKLNGTTITTLPAYLEYTVSYADDVPLATNQLLAAGTTEKYKVKIKYSEDINLNQIPATNQNLTLQFTVKYKQADENAIEPNRLYNIIRDAATEGTYAKKYTGDHHDSFTEEPSKDIYSWGSRYTDQSISETISNKINIIFAGFCWKMVRTTDTGGVKMIYNGVSNSGQCNNSGVDASIGTSTFNSRGNNPTYVGYMYNPDALISNRFFDSATSGSLFGTGITYSNGTYALTNTSTTYDANHHYTCNNTTGSCSIVRYYYYKSYYIELSDGRTIQQALTDMLSADNVNQTNSTIKTVIDNWYATNMTNYTSKLEDTIFCNDRSISSLGGWNPSGGEIEGALSFIKSSSSKGNLSCTNETDKFSLSNNKARLIYPVGLLTYPEIEVLNNSRSIATGSYYWLLSPLAISEYTKVYTLSGTGATVDGAISVTDSRAVRPVVSLKPGTLYTSGDGSKSNPYIVE